MRSVIQLGLVGCGRLAEIGYAAAAARSSQVEIAAVADPDPTRCRAVASNVPAFESAEDLIANADIDAIVLASPAESHLADARLAADAGLPTLVEKPPAPDAEGASALAELSPAPWIGFNRRFEPILGCFAAVRHEEPAHIEIKLHYRRASWSPVTVNDDALLDLGPHLVDLATWITDSPVRRVRALDLRPTRARLELDLEHGSAVVEGATDSPHRETVELRSASGRPLARTTRGGLIRGALARLTPDKPHPLVLSLGRQLDAFAAAVRDEDPGALATAAEGARAMAVIDGARRSAQRSGAWETASELVPS